LGKPVQTGYLSQGFAIKNQTSGRENSHLGADFSGFGAVFASRFVFFASMVFDSKSSFRHDAVCQRTKEGTMCCRRASTGRTASSGIATWQHQPLWERNMRHWAFLGRLVTTAGLIIVFWVFGLVNVVIAQGEAATGIQTSGTSTIQVTPTKIRLSLTMEAEADDAKKAIKLLQTHKEKVRQSLSELKAEDKSIQFSSTRLEQNDGFPPNYPSPAIRARIMQQANNRGVDPEDLPVIFIAKADLQVDWSLPTADADAIALLVSALKEQVIEKDLIGKNIESDIADELRDKVESLQQMAMQQGYYIDSSASGGGLTVALVGEVTAEQRKAAIKAAYDEAVSNAQDIAAATGKSFKKVLSIRETESAPSLPVQTVQNVYGQMVQTSSSNKPADRNVVTGTDVDSLRKTITVTVIHSIE
jgi:uncharacterized protein YggE